MSYTLQQAKDVLAGYNTTYSTALMNTNNLQKQLNALRNTLNNVITSNADTATITAANVAMNNKLAELNTSLTYAKTLNIAKKNAQSVVNVANNISSISGPTENPFIGATGIQGPQGPQGPIGPTGPQLSSFNAGIKISALSEVVVPATVSGNTITLDYSLASCFFTNATFTSNMTINVVNVPYTTANAIYSVTLIYPPTSNKYYGATLQVSTTTSGLVTANDYTLGAAANVASSMASANTYAVHQINIVNSAGTIIYLSSINGYAV